MFQALYELLFPPTCPVCQQAKPAFHGFLCLGCLADLSFSLRPKGIQPVEKAFWGRVPVHSAYSWLRFNPQNRTRDLLHAIKYDQDERLGQAMGRRFGRDLLSVIHDPPDLILPVPLHAKKMKRRGFNQAEAIAKGMSEVLKIPINSTLLSRTEHQASLTKLSRIDRWIFPCNLACIGLRCRGRRAMRLWRLS